MKLGMDAGSARPRIANLLGSLYGEVVGEETTRAVIKLLEARAAAKATRPPNNALSASDVLLISYADQVREAGAAPLRSLAEFCGKHLADVVSGVHILPFYPWSSDDGFAVKDYFEVAPEYGTWDDITVFRERFDLMFDAVFNHMSAQSQWFQRFLRDESGFRDFFVTVDGEPDLSQAVRPRALPLLTEFQGAGGLKKVWTTFSADQVDLNFKNPRVLLAVVKVLLFYVAHGARFIRLDAIAYLWKKIGTPCIHLPETHAVIQLMRAVLDEVAPHVQLITETNVPHAENVLYFGDGANEAQLVYNFTLPPLVLHAVLRGDATHLSRWASAMNTPSPRTTFFNFLASHDGIGLNPVREILPDAEIQFLVEHCQVHGGFISYKHSADGTRSPYEMNVVYFDALSDPESAEPTETQVDRFMVAQAIMLALAGVPAIYFHSLFGSRNDREAARQSGINRRINRQKLVLKELERDWADNHSLRARVFERYRALLKARRSREAFNPSAGQEVLEKDKRLFIVLRTAADGANSVLCLHNVTNENVEAQVTTSQVAAAITWKEMFHNRRCLVPANGTIQIRLRPYEVNWLEGQGSRPVQIVAVT